MSNTSSKENIKTEPRMHFDKTNGLDLGQIVEDNKGANFIFCIGFNSIGKTYSVENGIAQMIKDGKRCVGIRNTEKEVDKCKQGGLDTLRRNDMLDGYTVKNTGIYKMTFESATDKKGKVREVYNKTRDELVCPFVFMSSLDTSIPQIDQCRAFVYDEFIAGNEKRTFKIKNPLNDIKKMFFRLSRPATADTHIPFVFISNPHNLESDLLTDGGIDLDGDKLACGEDIIIEDHVHKTLVLCFPTEWNIAANGLQQTYFAAVNDRQAYTFRTNEYKRIVPRLECDKTLHYYLTWKGENYAVYHFDRDGRDWFGIERKRDYLNEEGAMWFCFLESDKVGEVNIFLDNDHMLEYTSILHSYQLDGARIMYDSVFTKEMIKELLFESNIVEQFLKER